jgi:hypothetical protein
MFAICLAPVGGALALGGEGPFSAPGAAVQYVPLSKNDFYRITIVDVLVVRHVHCRRTILNTASLIEPGRQVARSG